MCEVMRILGTGTEGSSRLIGILGASMEGLVNLSRGGNDRLLTRPLVTNKREGLVSAIDEKE